MLGRIFISDRCIATPTHVKFWPSGEDHHCSKCELPAQHHGGCYLPALARFGHSAIPRPHSNQTRCEQANSKSEDAAKTREHKEDGTHAECLGQPRGEKPDDRDGAIGRIRNIPIGQLAIWARQSPVEIDRVPVINLAAIGQMARLEMDVFFDWIGLRHRSDRGRLRLRGFG